MLTVKFNIVIALSVLFSFSQAYNPLGTGADGPLNVPQGEVVFLDDVISPVTGLNSAGTYALLVQDSDLFSIGDELLIITMRDPEPDFAQNQTGLFEFHQIVDIGDGILILQEPLERDYDATGESRHQVLKIYNLTEVTIDGTLTCTPWNGSTGGILFFRSSETVEITETGHLTADGTGYRGGTQYGNSHGGGQGGESYVGLGGLGGNYNYNDAMEGAAGGGAAYAYYHGRNGIAGGGGGGTADIAGLGSPNNGGSGGGGGGHAGSGGGGGYGGFGFGGNGYANVCTAENGGDGFSGNGCVNYTGGGGGGGGTYGTADLSRLMLGSSGGCGGRYDGRIPGFGGNGGGILVFGANNLINNGLISSDGTDGIAGGQYCGGGGGAAGGSLSIFAYTIQNSNSIQALGGIGGRGDYGNYGGDGGIGRIRMDYVQLDNAGTIQPDAFLPEMLNIVVWQVSNTSNMVGPYNIQASIVPDDDGIVTEAILHYRVNGSDFITVAMTNTLDNMWVGDIPGQQAEATIEYYITATDGVLDYQSPTGAPNDFYSFQVTGFAPLHLTLTNNLDGSVNLEWLPPPDLNNLTSYSLYRSEDPLYTPGPANQIATEWTELLYLDTDLQDFHTYYYTVMADYNFSGAIFSYPVTEHILVNIELITTVAGIVRLEGQSNHANIKIKFNPISPSAVLDSTYTDALGNYEIHINPGIYTVEASKVGYQSYNILQDFSIIEDTESVESILYDLGITEVSGDVSGVWDGIYTITGDITVVEGDTLIVTAGTEVRFLNNVSMVVSGYLAVDGSELEPVLFTSLPANQIKAPGQWQGIDFFDTADDNSFLMHAIVEYGVDGLYTYMTSPQVDNCILQYNSNSGSYVDDGSNTEFRNTIMTGNTVYGLYVRDNAWPYLDNCSLVNTGRGLEANNLANFTLINSDISNNINYGMVLYNSNPWIYNCTIFNNVYSGIYAHDNATPLIEDCELAFNSEFGIYLNDYTYTGTVITGCNIHDNISHGIYLDRENRPIIEDCHIQNNGGTGIQSYRDNDSTIRNCIITGNAAYGLYVDYRYNTMYIHHNIFAFNGIDGIYLEDSDNYYYIYYNTIYGNGEDGIELNSGVTQHFHHNIIANNGADGVQANSAIEVFEYNDVFGNLNSDLYNLANFPIDTWQFVSMNANGDSADIYLNINVEPAFELSDSLDFTLMLNSPCINAGGLTVLDPDGSVSDLGAWYRDAGNPHWIVATGYADQTVTLDWAPVELGSLVSYNVYYREADTDEYILAENTTETTLTISDLINNQLYEFTVTGVHVDGESIFAPAVTERPGASELAFDPDALNFITQDDTTTQVLEIINNGSRNLELDFVNMPGGTGHFDGSGDYVHIGDHAHLEGMTALTLECWVKRNNSGHLELISKHYLHYSIFINSSNNFGMYKGYDGSNNQSWYTNTLVPVNEWHHLATTWTGNDILFYLDGELVHEVNNAFNHHIPTNGYNLELGRRGSQNAYYLNGDIAEARVWNVVRSQAELQDWMNHPLNGDEPGLVGYWPLHTDFNDYSPYGIHGTPYGNVYPNTNSFLPSALPLMISESQLTVAPGEMGQVDFTFYNFGQNGTFTYTTPIWTNYTNQPVVDYEISITYGETVPATPVHFLAVAASGLPYSIVVTSAEIDGVSLEVGDEIGIFDGDLCVGAGIFDGSFNFVVTAWQGDDGQGLAGFTPGNPMTFMLYDTSADQEAITETTYSIGNGSFGYGQFSALDITGTIYKFQDVAVTGGVFNLISFNKLPRYTNIPQIFGTVDNLQIAYNDQGGAFIPEFGINSIGELDFRDGYHLFSTTPDTILFEGLNVNPEEWDMVVAANRWNSIAYLGEDALDITLAFPDTLVDSISIVQTSSGEVWIPALDVNSIGTLLPGKGYQIALSSSTDIVFQYQTSNGFTRPVYYEPLATEFFQVSPTGLPYTVLLDINQSEFDLNCGDELALYDGDLCVAAGKFTGTTPVVLTAWSADLEQELSGFTPGSPIAVFIYQQDTGHVQDVQYQSINGAQTFGASHYAHLNLTLSPELPQTYALNPNYPNPFNPATNISYALPEDTSVKLIVYDLTGRQITVLEDGFQQAGYHRLTWPGLNAQGAPVASGVYLLRIHTPRFTATHKMLLLR